MKKRILCLILCLLMCLGTVSLFSSCGDKGTEKPDALVIMTEQLDGLFNPFFSTSGADGTIVAMTQIGMLTSKYVGGEEGVIVGYGDDEAVVVKDYDESYDQATDTTTYRFVLKNGILFSDGNPLTMEDVLFNYYVYLDPVYTGSSTIYSTDIVGLNAYRTQQESATEDSDDGIAGIAATRGENRRNELVSLFLAKKEESPLSTVSRAEMNTAILAHSLSSGYKQAVSTNPSEVTNQQLLDDYNKALQLFREELERDYASAQESFTEAPYNQASIDSYFDREVFCFLYYEGYITLRYAEKEGGGYDRGTILGVDGSDFSHITTKDAAIDYVFNDKIATALDEVLMYWASGSDLLTDFTAKAKEVFLHENTEDGELVVPNISGIVSLGHTDMAGTTITLRGDDNDASNDKTYTIASGHNTNGTVTNENEYDVLQITINGVDPKAIWNFAITIAPQHYYGEGAETPVSIENNQFGVDFASFDFMTGVVQQTRNIRLPMGAGAYKVTNVSNSDNPGETEFYTNNVVYFKRNTNFETVGNFENAKIEKVRYQVVSSSNAVDALANGSVHYISPSMTNKNYTDLENLSDKGIVTLDDWQLGYGYIGINAAKVNDVNIRKAIMHAMDTSLALDYYRSGAAEQIYWPMSKVSWAYPDTNGNGKAYPVFGDFVESTQIAAIQRCMSDAGVAAGDSSLKMKFTIAGSNLQDHPTYKVFRDAADLLNSLGWDVEVVCDTQALTKINTGALTVWAAAWSSALDPDLYQVYHMDSTATSTLAWGYNYLKVSGTDDEIADLEELSEYIDQARETTDKTERTRIYKLAMEKILDLAIELPVYQRKVLYAYNSNVISQDSMPSASELNPYSTPLDRIWELEFAQ